VLKTYVMMLNDYVMSMSLILLVLRLLIAHNWDFKSLILKISLFSISVHIIVNKINCTQGPWVYRSTPIMNKVMFAILSRWIGV
jgi:hypothetical protein